MSLTRSKIPGSQVKLQIAPSRLGNNLPHSECPCLLVPKAEKGLPSGISGASEGHGDSGLGSSRQIFFSSTTGSSQGSDICIF